MKLDLTRDETATLLRELDGIIDGESLLRVAAHQDPESDPHKDPAENGARAVANAATIRTAASGRS